MLRNKKSLLLILLPWCCAHGLIANTTMVNTASCYLVGPTYQYNARTGYYDFSELQKSQAIDRGSVHLFGAVVGKRYPLAKYARIQLAIGVDAGSKTDDTVNIGAYDATTINFFYFHTGAHPELQLSLPSLTLQRLRPYVSIGGGLNYLYLQQRTFYQGMRIVFIDQPYAQEWRFSLDGSVGGGLDCSLSRNATVSVSYSFLYWQPVKYSTPWDFPLKSQNYRETFYTHKLVLALLLEFR